MGSIRWYLLIPMLAVIGLAGYRIWQLQAPLPKVPELSPVRVDTLELRRQPFSAWAFAEGTAESLHKAFLSFEQAGKVVFISSLEDGTPIREGVRVFGPSENVRLGQLLARLDDRENASQVQALEARLQSARELVSEARAQHNIAHNNQHKAKQDFERVEKLHSRGLIASNELERERTGMLNAGDAVAAARSAQQAVLAEEKGIAAELNRATVSLEKTSLFAPFDGVISTMNLVKNNYFYPPAAAITRSDREAGSAIVVVDDSRYEVRLEVPEYHARHIREGQTVYLAHDDQLLYQAAEQNFSSENETTGVVKGTVWSVSPAISLQYRSQLVKVRTQMDAGELRDGMFVRAWIVTREIPAALALPLQALSFNQGAPYVFVIDQNTIAKRHWLTLGARGLKSIEVTQGLAEGDRVVVRGQHLLADHSRVQIVGSR